MDKEQLLLEIKQLIADSSKGLITEKVLNEKIEAINAQLKAINDKEDNHKEVKELKESFDALKQAVTENAAAVKALTEQARKPVSNAPVKRKDALRNALMEDIKNAMKKTPDLVTMRNDENGERESLAEYFAKGNRQTPEITLKVATDMFESNIVQANISTVRLTELDPQRVGIPASIYPHVVDFMPSRSIGKPRLALEVTYSYVDGSGTKTEGEASGKSSFLLKTVEFPSFYIATHFPLSDETMDDLPEVLEEIAFIGPDKVNDKIDSKILSTAGDDSTDIAGLFTANKMTAFASATTYATKVPDATIVDVFEKMKHQASTNKRRANVLMLNSMEVSKMGARYDEIGNSVNDRRVVYNTIGEPTFVAGMRIIVNDSMTENTCAVFQNELLVIGNRKEMTLQIGYNSDDLTKGKMTAVIKRRLAFGVRDKGGVIYCADIDAAIAAITV